MSGQAQAVVVGNDPAFDFGRLRAASRAVAGGAAFFAVNMDARFPVAEDQFDPGCGALAEAIAVAAGVRPISIGKPNPPLFEVTIARLGYCAAEAAMVGDNLPSDIAGGRAAGMLTIWLDDRNDDADSAGSRSEGRQAERTAPALDCTATRAPTPPARLSGEPS